MPSLSFLLFLIIYTHTFQNTHVSLSLKTCIASSNGSNTNILLLMHTGFFFFPFFLLVILKSRLCVGLCREVVRHSVHYIRLQIFWFRVKISKMVSLSSLISGSHYDFTFQLKAFYLQESE